MSVRKPLVIVNGEFSELPSGDSLNSDAVSQRIAAHSGSCGLSLSPSVTLASPTTVDIGSGQAIFTDPFTDHINPVTTEVNFGPFTGVTALNIGTQPVTFIFIDKLGALYKTNGYPTPEVYRDYALLAVLGHGNFTSITSIRTVQSVIHTPLQQLWDLCWALGFFKISGSVYSANGANLSVNVSAGTTFALHTNSDLNEKSPHISNLSSYNAPTIAFQIRTGTVISTSTNVDVTNYDLGGVLTALNNNKFTVHRFFRQPKAGDALTYLQYGQIEYATLAEAKAAITSEAYVTNPNLAAYAVLCGFLIVKKGTTALNNTLDAQFIDVNKFGAAAGTGASVSTFQDVYNNSLDPEIITSTAKGSLTIKNNQAADTDVQFDVKNLSNVVRFSVTGEGTVYSYQKIQTVAGTSYTLLPTDSNSTIRFTSTTAVTVTVDTSLPIGFSVRLVAVGNGTTAGDITVTAGVGVTLKNAFGMYKTRTIDSQIEVVVTAPNLSHVMGDVKA